MKINLEQKKTLSNYSGNLSIAWFAAGIIAPIVTKQKLSESGDIIVISALFSVVLFVFMLNFIKEKNYKVKRK